MKKIVWIGVGALMAVTTIVLLNIIEHSFISPSLYKGIDPTNGGYSIIDKETAYRWTENHRNRETIILQDDYKSGRSNYFTESFLKSVLDQPECEGLNFYIAFDDNKDTRLVVVGLSSVTKKDLTGSYKDPITGENKNYIIGASEMKCPNNCDDSSDLLK